MSCAAAPIPIQQCRTYIRVVQQSPWFVAAFPGHDKPVTVAGGRGVSRADFTLRWLRIGVTDRANVATCEHACLHELAHLVTPDHGPDRAYREPSSGADSSKGHHHAWRANFVVIVHHVLGRSAARRLEAEFTQWGLPTRTAGK